MAAVDKKFKQKFMFIDLKSKCKKKSAWIDSEWKIVWILIKDWKFIFLFDFWCINYCSELLTECSLCIVLLLDKYVHVCWKCVMCENVLDTNKARCFFCKQAVYAKNKKKYLPDDNFFPHFQMENNICCWQLKCVNLVNVRWYKSVFLFFGFEKMFKEKNIISLLFKKKWIIKLTNFSYLFAKVEFFTSKEKKKKKILHLLI